MSAIREARLNYLAKRNHIIGSKNPREQAVYLHGEAAECLIAAKAYWPNGASDELFNLMGEIADVVICADVLAGMLGVTVEDCITLKTDKDRGRG